MMTNRCGICEDFFLNDKEWYIKEGNFCGECIIRLNTENVKGFKRNSGVEELLTIYSQIINEKDTSKT